MVEKYLGKTASEDIFRASMLTGLVTEKQASELMEGIEKDAFSIAKLLNSLKAPAVATAAGMYKAVPSLALAGLGTGAFAGGAYRSLVDRLEQEDPNEKFNLKLEALYENRRRELEDAKWMTRVRAMRDELKRGYKKMTPEEYSAKYNELMDALDERKD